jgi:hypothetical protein
MALLLSDAYCMAKASILFGEERSDPWNLAHFSGVTTGSRKGLA